MKRFQFYPSIFLPVPTRLAIAISVITMSGSPLLLAQGATRHDLNSNWYGGFNIGHTYESINDGAIANHELGGGLTTITDDDRDNGYKLFAGYLINDIFLLEAGYFDLGQFGSRATKTNISTLQSRTKTKGFSLDVLGSLPLTEKFSAFARVGVHYSEVKNRFQGISNLVAINHHHRERDVNFKWGGGLQYDFTAKFGMRIEAERYAINDTMNNNGSINFYSLGIVYRFGSQHPTRTQLISNRDMPDTSIDPPTLEEYCSMLDIQFEINNADIQREDFERLSVVGIFLAKYPEASVVIEGHTDNVGSPEDNQALSRHRAESVLSYLVKDQGVDRARLLAVGFGDTRPIASNATEEGKRANRRINTVISCVNDIEGLSPAAARMTMAMLMEFDVNSAVVKPQYHKELAKVAKFLRENRRVTATVEGHTAGLQVTVSNSHEISLRRAQNVVDYLVNSEGIERARLTAEGFGESRRFSYNTSLGRQQENRRVNIIFTYPKNSLAKH
ncbi:OmpA family protein [Cellvibrio sp. UBA7661]|uniref:OmpA family protein n=1 Tax=Cellvibrio sp. UBA7661 TaxID=1946311 RepID=UPI002F351899